MQLLEFPNKRISSTLLLALVAGMSYGDLVLHVTVSGSGAGQEGNPAAGSYEIDYRGNLARLVRPDQSTILFNFATDQAAILDSTAQTYKLATIENLLSTSSTATATTAVKGQVLLQSTTQSQTLLGYTSQRFSIGPEPLALGRGQSVPIQSGGFALFQPPLTGPSVRLAQMAPFTPNGSAGTVSTRIASFTGETWLTEAGSEVQSSAPLSWISVPPSLAASFSKSVDSRRAAPLQTSFSYKSATTGAAMQLQMTVGTVSAEAVAAALVEIPSTYRQSS